jgi:uncharacterized damage-inducible protein DinB
MLDTSSIPGRFIEQAIQHVQNEFLSRITDSVALLSDQELWWRPNESSNSIGNLLLHLSGNVRQWIISGLGGKEDLREREKEFMERGSASAQELLSLLRATVSEAVSVLHNLSEESLLEKHRIQVYDVDGIQAIFHVVEHFSGHTGQIIYIVKMLKDKDLRFYDL